METIIIPYNKKHFDELFSLVHRTIEEIYPAYYPMEAVDFFHHHHSHENMKNDITSGTTLLLMAAGKVAGTGSAAGNEIRRLFVLPEERGRGYGRMLVEELEKTIIRNRFTEAVLDASLCSRDFYINLGYEDKAYCILPLENGASLCYFHMQKRFNSPFFSSVDYNGRVFASSSNSRAGEVDEKTFFHYRQEGNVVWADYSGGRIKKGFLIGTADRSGSLFFTYQHINSDNIARTGKCESHPSLLSDGRLEMHEKWEWINGDMSKGESTVTEIRGEK